MSGEQLLAALRGKGLIDESNSLRLAKQAQDEQKSVDALLSDLGILPDEQVAAVKSEILRVPYKEVPDEIPETVIALIPEDTAQTYQVIPLSADDNNVVVGMVNPDDLRAQEALKFLARQHRKNLGVFLVSYGDYKKAMSHYSPYQDDIAEAVQSMRVKTRGTSRRTTQATNLEQGKKGDEAPVIRLVARTLKEAVQGGASDIHIEPTEKVLRVRFRVDGDLRKVAELPAELSDAVIARLKVLSDLKIDERRVPQDGRFRSRLFDREIDFRVATFPTPLGEKMAIRVLDPSKGLKQFDDLDWRQLNNIITGYFKRLDRETKQSWHQARMIMWATLLPHQKKNSNLKPEDVMPLPWDNKETEVEFKQASAEDIKKSFEFWNKQDSKNREIEQ